MTIPIVTMTYENPWQWSLLLNAQSLYQAFIIVMLSRLPLHGGGEASRLRARVTRSFTTFRMTSAIFGHPHWIFLEGLAAPLTQPLHYGYFHSNDGRFRGVSSLDQRFSNFPGSTLLTSVSLALL